MNAEPIPRMKRLIFFVVLILSFYGCSEFQHLHYRHVKKVPAKGFVAPFSIEERNVYAEKKVAEEIDSAKLIETGTIAAKQDSAILYTYNNPGYHPPVFKKQTENSAPSKPVIRDKLKLKKTQPHRKGGDGSLFLIVVFLFLGICLMLLGGSLFVAAFYGFTLWMVVLGLVIFLLGLLPFLGLLSFAFGGSYDKAPNYNEKR